MRTSSRGIGLLGFVLLGSCAHPSNSQSEIDQMNRTVEALRAQNTAYAKQVEELENRVFILSDQLESRKINDERAEAPKLPTIALHPIPAPEVPAPMAPPGTESAAEPEIEYAGEAAKPSTHRPVLRLHGESGELSIVRDPQPTPREPAPAPTLRVLREGGGRAPKEDSPEAIALYRKSSEALRMGKHDEAAQGFREFLRAYPNHDLADNSQYWLGECFYDRKDFAQAVREFRRVIERYPSGNKVPDALLKVGFSYLALGSVEAGKQTLLQLQRSYPRHEAAGLAANRLAELDRTTHARAAGETGPVEAPQGQAARASQEVP